MADLQLVPLGAYPAERPLRDFHRDCVSQSKMTKTSAYNVMVGMTVALGSFTYGFGTCERVQVSLPHPKTVVLYRHSGRDSIRYLLI